MKKLTEKQISKYRNDAAFHKIVKSVVNAMVELGYNQEDLEDVFEISRHKYNQLSQDIFKRTDEANRHLWE